MRLNFLQILPSSRNCDVRRKSNFVFVFLFFVRNISFECLSCELIDINLLLNHICGVYCSTANNDILFSDFLYSSSTYLVLFNQIWMTNNLFHREVYKSLDLLIVFISNIFCVEWKVLNKINSHMFRNFYMEFLILRQMNIVYIFI